MLLNIAVLLPLSDVLKFWSMRAQWNPQVTSCLADLLLAFHHLSMHLLEWPMAMHGNYQMTTSLISVSRICSATPIAVTLSRWCQVFVGEKFCVDVQITAQPATASLLLSHSSLHSKGA